jgi:hypothetical protein
MNRAHGTREAWQPHTEQDRDLILRELHAVLASPQFCNSKRYPALLEYIVRNTLAGRSDLLKERTLGVEVFKRPPTYDTNADTVVRYTAGEVRKRLLLYYSEHGREASLRISLPAGSYIPEFSSEHDDPREDGNGVHPHEPLSGELAAEAHQHSAVQPAMQAAILEPESALAAEKSAHGAHADVPAPVRHVERHRRRRALALAVAAAVVLVVLAGLWWTHRASQPQSALDAFWAPVLRDARPVVLCTGSVIFAPNNYSGVTTAGRDLDYTFVSMQIASAIAEISDVAESSGATSQLVSSASTPLTELREHPVILLGGYNNQWTLRLIQPLRFHFAPIPDERILDRLQPNLSWARDQAQPYSSADDYAIVARFHDPTIDGWVMAVAGVGRNGTEAAAQFVTSPHYMELLREQLGHAFAKKNLELVLKVNVIDGKSGAPSILAVHSW